MVRENIWGAGGEKSQRGGPPAQRLQRGAEEADAPGATGKPDSRPCSEPPRPGCCTALGKGECVVLMPPYAGWPK